MKWNLIGSVWRQPTQVQHYIILTLGVLMLLLATFLGNPSAYARDQQRRAYQESPLSPVATPITASTTSSLTTPITSSLPASQTAILTATAATTVTVPFTSPLPAPATTTLTSVMITSIPLTATLPVATSTSVPTAELLNRGQTSLLLVGAVLGGILVAIAVVIGRQR